MLDVIESIRTFNAGRDPERLHMKYARLRQDAFAFLRGTCHLFYQRLPRSAILRNAPLAWICGDLHLENFGSYKGDNRLVYFDLNDFDEAALAPCTWDLLRFLTSVLLAARTQSSHAGLGQHLCEHFVDAYGATLASGKARWIERETADGVIRHLLDGLRSRKRRDFLNARTTRQGEHRRILLDGRKALPVSDKQRKKILAFMTEYAAQQANPNFFKVRDLARRIAGTGSLGLDRYIILIDGKGSPDGNYFLDLKQACASSLTAVLRTPQPAWASEAERVVSLAQRAQAIPMAFAQPVSIGKKSYVLRGLQPSEDRVDIDFKSGSQPAQEALIRAMADLVAWSHLRSSGRSGSATADAFIAFAGKQKWPRQLCALAQSCCDAVEQDWQSYATAYDKGMFSKA